MNGTNCSYSTGPGLEARFVLFVGLVPLMATFSLIGNVLSISTFMRGRLRNANNYFLSLSAACDIGVSTTATMLYSVEVAYDFFQTFWLYEIWAKYLRWVFFMSHFFQMSSKYYTVAATLERYCNNVRRREVAMGQCEKLTVLILVLTVLVNSMRYFEILVIPNRHCTGFGQYEIQQASFALTSLYRTVVTLWLWHTLSLFLPFAILLFLNISITKAFRRKRYFRALGFAHPLGRLRQLKQIEERESTILLILVVTLILVCETPGFFLTLMEKTSGDFLDNHAAFHHYFRDLVNLLAVFQCCPNVIIYIAFGKQFRIELAQMLHLWSSTSRGRSIADIFFRESFKFRRHTVSTRHHRDVLMPIVTVVASSTVPKVRGMEVVPLKSHPRSRAGVRSLPLEQETLLDDKDSRRSRRSLNIRR